MNYRLIRNVRQKGRFLGVGVPALFAAAVVVFHLAYPAFLADIASRAVSPFWAVGRFFGDKTHGISLFFSSKQTLAEEALRLSNELEKAHALLLDREVLLEENRLLKEQFGRTDRTEGRIIAAVLTVPPRSPYDSVVIDVGVKDGADVGDRVLSGSLVLGTVSKAYSRTSIVELFSTAGRKTPVRILHEGTAIPVEGIGEGGGSFAATLPKEVTVNEGDAVVMPGMNPHLFATVEAIETSATDSFQKVRFKNPVPLSGLRFLEVEKSASQE